LLISIKMKTKLLESFEIPSGVECKYEGEVLHCKKGSVELKRKISVPRVKIKVDSGKITFECEKGNKNQFKIIKTHMAHLKNIFSGLDKKYTYNLEACNVHFPMTLKVDSGKLLINNFLGEKIPRFAIILPNTNVEIKGQKITVSSHDKELAGQTAANMEKATKVRNRDRRIFQDGIYITDKPGEN